MIDEKKLIKDIEKLSLKDSMEYMTCGCTVEQYENDNGDVIAWKPRSKPMIKKTKK